MQHERKRLRVLKDIGCGVHVQAEIPDTSKIFISIGLGFFPEVTLPEACTILKEKQINLHCQIKASQKEVASIEAHLELISDGLVGLRQLALAGA